MTDIVMLNKIKKIAESNASSVDIDKMFKKALKDIDDSKDNPDVVIIKYLNLCMDLKNIITEKTNAFKEISEMIKKC